MQLKVSQLGALLEAVPKQVIRNEKKMVQGSICSKMYQLYKITLQQMQKQATTTKKLSKVFKSKAFDQTFKSEVFD